jgi:signal transduction histidine kinase/ActR/RegA family two-component response regulator
MLHLTLVAAAILGAVAYVPGVMAAAGVGLWSLVVTDTVVWGLIVGMALGRRRIAYRTRALGFLSIWFLLSLHLLLAVGPIGGGAVWLATFPVGAGLLLGVRGSAVSLTLTTVLVLGMAVLVHLDPVGPWGPPSALGYDLVSWAATGGSLLFVAGVLSLSIAFLARSLERHLSEVDAAREEVAQANERLKAEVAERRELQDRLLQSQKMEALGTLAGGIAHDFNNLLVPILMEAQDVRDQLPQDSPARESLEDVVRSAIRARDLVRRILAFSRQSREARVPTEVVPVAREVAGLLRSSIPANIQLRTEFAADGARVLADPGELHQIFMNLATNGYLAMKEGGGTLTLSVRREPGSDDGSHEIVLSVVDTGEGMPPQVRERVFDPFFTTRAPGEGTGLGLTTVHSVATNLNGVVFLDSEPGRGTSVEVRFPESRDGTSDSDFPFAEEGEEAAPAGTAFSGRGLAGWTLAANVLIVDDEPMVRRTTRMLLVRMGLTVTEAPGPEDALRKLRDAPFAFDLVLTDQTMPGMTGIELAEEIARVRPEIPVILVSGFLDEAKVHRARQVGVIEVLEKPFEQAAVARAVTRTLDRRREDGRWTGRSDPFSR